jgi:hypothetical protein
MQYCNSVKSYNIERGLLPFLSSLIFLSPRKAGLHFFPNRLSWFSVFLLIKVFI